MKMNVLRFISLVIIFSLIPTNANAEQLKRYKIVYPDGSFVMNAGTTNPVVVEGYPSVYSTLIFSLYVLLLVCTETIYIPGLRIDSLLSFSKIC